MATTNPLMKQDNLEAWGDEPAHERLRIWLGILNGLFIGAAVVLGAWGPEFYRLADLSVARPYNGLVMSSLLILFVCGLVGWLTAVGRKFWLTLLSWIAAAVILTILIANTATALQTTAIWLADRRFWGFSIYPATTAVPFVTYVFGGLFMMLAFFLFAIFQETRLQEIGREFLGGQHPGIVAWLRFTLPLLLVVAVAAITNNVFPNPFGASLALVDRAIHVARTYEGDLFALGLEQGENYAGISAVRDQLDGAYTLSFGAVDTATDTVIILAYFDSGVWIRCRLVNQQLSFCEDASRPYTIGLAHLLTGAPLPEDCQGCLPKVSDEWTAWLAEQQVHFQGELTITRQAAEGSYILMRAESENGRYAVTCWFSGQPRVQIDRCATES